jgi:hypothetical protein
MSSVEDAICLFIANGALVPTILERVHSALAAEVMPAHSNNRIFEIFSTDVACKREVLFVAVDCVLIVILVVTFALASLAILSFSCTERGNRFFQSLLLFGLLAVPFTF